MLHARIALKLESRALKDLALRDGGEAETLEEVDGLGAVCMSAAIRSP